MHKPATWRGQLVSAINRTGTLKGLAAKLGLSVTTVSRALGGYSDVSAATRQRVLDAASEVGYVPNAAAKMLVSGRSGFIGFLLPLQVPAILDPFLGEYITGLSEGLSERGRDLFMATVPPGQSELSVLKHVVESGRADGVVLTRIAEDDERVDYLLNRGFPFVTHGRTDIEDAGYSWIDTDGYKAFGDTFNWLYSLGHRRFTLLSITEAMTFRSHREAGFEHAQKARSDPAVSVATYRVPRFDNASRIETVRAVLQSKDRPTAILALTDELALCVLEQATALGISVPDQLSVVGFDNIPQSAYATPGLTTFDQSIRAAARQIADMLLDSLDGEKTNGVSEDGQSVDAQSRRTQTLLTPELILRGSHSSAPEAVLSVAQGSA